MWCTSKLYQRMLNPVSCNMENNRNSTEQCHFKLTKLQLKYGALISRACKYCIYYFRSSGISRGKGSCREILDDYERPPFCFSHFEHSSPLNKFKSSFQHRLQGFRSYGRSILTEHHGHSISLASQRCVVGISAEYGVILAICMASCSFVARLQYLSS